MTSLHYLNGRWVKTPQLKISVFDLAVVRGFGVFDFLRTYHQKPFHLKDHLHRLFRSAKTLGIIVPKNKTEIENLVYRGIRKNKSLGELSIRIIVTGGVGIDSVTPGKPSLIIIFEKIKRYPKRYYQKGVKVITYKGKREFSSVKSLNYLSAIIALQLAKKEGAVEAIYIDKKKIYEGTTSNFFAVIDNQLITPKNGVLIGITRNVVINLAKKLKITIVERDLFLEEVDKFKEVFITASNKEIMPVVQIDNKIVDEGKVGAITKKLMKEFFLITQKPTC